MRVGELDRLHLPCFERDSFRSLVPADDVGARSDAPRRLGNHIHGSLTAGAQPRTGAVSLELKDRRRGLPDRDRVQSAPAGTDLDKKKVFTVLFG